MSIEPRLMERRRTVAEDKAKRNVSRLLKFLASLLVLGAAVWLVFSPWLSVSQVDAVGISVSRANSILADQGVVAGTPMIRIGVEDTEQALLADPWIATAQVSLDWPDRVVVEIVERTPVAWTQTADGWTRRAIDGAALPSEPEPDPDMARIELPGLSPGEAASDPDMAGALQFVDTLAPRLHPGTVVYSNEGELWATVSGHQVRLGRGVEMAAKALSLQALLEEELPEDAILVLIAPTNPAVTTPSSQTGEDDQVDGETGAGQGTEDVTDGDSAAGGGSGEGTETGGNQAGDGG